MPRMVVESRMEPFGALLFVLTLAGAGRALAFEGRSPGAAPRAEALPLPALPPSGAPQETTLPNGLTVLLRPSPDAPVVAFQMWVRVGSGDEQDDEAGMAHVFEHMLFKGTDKRGVGEIARDVEGAGGYINAYTTYDVTVYHLVLPAREFDMGLDIVSDAVQHSAFDPKELAKEEQVVLEEIRRGDDVPERHLEKALFAESFHVHPYRRPVIGYREIVEKFSREQILGFFHRWYVPNNMVLVVAGDFDARLARAKIERSFRDFASAPDPHRPRPPEPEQHEIRTVTMAADVRESHVQGFFHIPQLSSRDTYALDVLATILGGGDASRLFKDLKTRRNLVHGIDADTFAPRDPGIFILDASLEAASLGEALPLLLQDTFRMRAEGPTREEMDRARTSLESQFVYQRESAQGEARLLGYGRVLADDLSFDRHYIEGVRAVTPEEVVRAAREYLRPDNLTLGVLVPEKGVPLPTPKEILRIVQRAAKEAEAESRARPPGPAAATRKVLPNGVTVIVKENHASPIVAFQATMLGGLLYEGQEKAGIFNFASSLLLRGTESRTADEIAETLDRLGGSASGFSGRNSFGLSTQVLSQNYDDGLAIFSDLLLHSSFPADEVDKRRKDLLDALKNLQDNPVQYAFQFLAKALYGAHPFGHKVLGDPESVASVTRADLAGLLDRYRVPGNLVVTVVGDVSTDRALATLEETFGPLRGPKLPPPGNPRVEAPAEREVVQHVPGKEQAQVFFGFLAPDFKSEDRFPMEVLAAILSNQGGRLFYQLRDQEALAYAISASFVPGMEPGFFYTYLGCAPDKRERAVQGLTREIDRLLREGVSREELDRTKRLLVGSYEIGLQTDLSQASDMAFNERYGLGYEFMKRYPEILQKITAKDVLRVARKYLDPSRRVQTLLIP